MMHRVIPAILWIFSLLNPGWGDRSTAPQPPSPSLVPRQMPAKGAGRPQSSYTMTAATEPKGMEWVLRNDAAGLHLPREPAVCGGTASNSSTRTVVKNSNLRAFSCPPPAYDVCFPSVALHQCSLAAVQYLGRIRIPGRPPCADATPRGTAAATGVFPFGDIHGNGDGGPTGIKQPTVCSFPPHSWAIGIRVPLLLQRT